MLCYVFFTYFSASAFIHNSFSRAWGELLSWIFCHSKLNLTALETRWRWDGARLESFSLLRSDKQQMKKWRRNESSSKKRKTTHKSYYLKLKKRRMTTIITCRMEWRVDEVKNRPQEIGTKEDENFICNLFILISRVSRPFIRRTKDSPRPENSFRVI